MQELVYLFGDLGFISLAAVISPKVFEDGGVLVLIKDKPGEVFVSFLLGLDRLI